MLKKFVALALLGSFSAGCANNQAFFHSEPPGARVYIDGQAEAVGVTPCKFRYRNGLGGAYKITLEREGYEILCTNILADEMDKSARKKWLAAGLVWSPLWLGTFFTRKLKDSYKFTLKKSAPLIAARTEGLMPQGSY